MVIVSSPGNCGCCGEPAVNSAAMHPRCEKHAGRSPCIVPGCGRTFALQPGDDYDILNCCGKHWRMSPKHYRDRCAEIRKMARKRGWTDGLLRMHNHFWHKAVDSVINGDTMVPEEINKMFGLDEQ